ncbi:MAG: glycosyltransferase family 2 protein [Acidimicrobiales bacterium]
MAEVRDPHPMVGVVVVNYRATRLTLACVESLVRTRWPADRLAVMVVDNSDDADLTRLLAQRFPAVLHRASGGNGPHRAQVEIYEWLRKEHA